MRRVCVKGEYCLMKTSLVLTFLSAKLSGFVRLYRREANRQAAARLRERKRQMEVDFEHLKAAVRNTEIQNGVLHQQVNALAMQCIQAEQEKDSASSQQSQVLSTIIQQRDTAIQACEQWKKICIIQRDVIDRYNMECAQFNAQPPSGSSTDDSMLVAFKLI